MLGVDPNEKKNQESKKKNERKNQDEDEIDYDYEYPDKEMLIECLGPERGDLERAKSLLEARMNNKGAPPRNPDKMVTRA